MSENTSNVKKLCLYCIDCLKASGSSSAFNNLKSNKDNKIIYTNADTFEADNREIIEIMTLQALNKSTMSIIKGDLFLSGKRGRDTFYSPLLYTEAELRRENDIIKLNYDNDNITVNIGLISSLLENDSDIIENTIRQLLEIEEPQNIDFKKVLSGLINLNGFTIEEKQAIILAKTPEAISGMLNELKQIAEIY